jgi:sigma-B regulation protein RsbU (phosphoserine phosphatase)
MTTMDMGIERQLEVSPVAFVSALIDKSVAQIQTLLNRSWNKLSQYQWDLESSISIQQMLLPGQPPVLPGIDLAVCYIPKMGVSGDYYDFIRMDDNQVGIAIGDICGKGLGTTPMMASVCISLRAQAQENLLSAGELMSQLNKTICHNTADYQFVTMVYGIWDENNNIFTYSNAGHPPVLYYEKATGRIHELGTGGMLLGVFDHTEYHVESIPLSPGDALIFYTDGIIESTNKSNEIFGVNRLTEVIKSYIHEKSEILADKILSAASMFAGQEWMDDVTLMVLKRVNA